ncbi:hypothetical protein JCM14469_20440 [Desulfatiferula olefinivorans]
MLYTISKTSKNRAQALLLAAFAWVLIVAGCSATQKGAVATVDAGSDGERVISGLTVTDEAGTIKVAIDGNSPLRYTSVKQAFPLGIVLYFPGTKLENVDSEYPPEGNLLNSIKTSQQSHSSGYDSRIKILLNKDVDYDVIRQDNDLIVTLVDPEAADAGETITEPEMAAAPVEEESLTVESGAGMEFQDAEAEGDQFVSDQTDQDTAGDASVVEVLEPVEEPLLIVDENEDLVPAEPEAYTPEELEPVAAGFATASRITAIDKMVADDSADVLIEADGAINDYKVFTIPGTGEASGRIVCDIFNVKGPSTKGEQTLAVNALGVRQVRYFSYPDKTRVVVDTTNANLSSYTAEATPRGLTLKIGAAAAINPETGVESSDLTPTVETGTDESPMTETDTGLDATVDEMSNESVAVTTEAAEEVFADSGSDVTTFEETPVDDEAVTAGAVVVTESDDDVAAEDEPVMETDDTFVTAETEPWNEPAASSETIESVEPTEDIVLEEPGDLTPVAAEPMEEEQALAMAGDAWINRIDFTAEKDGKSSVIIGTTQPVEYKVTKKDGSTIHFKLYGAKLPNSRKFPFITTRFESAVNRIIPVQTPAMKTSALFIIELRESVPYYVDQRGGTITLNFEASSVPAQPEDMAGLPIWKEVLSQTPEIQEMEMAAADGESVMDQETPIDTVPVADETVIDETPAADEQPQPALTEDSTREAGETAAQVPDVIDDESTVSEESLAGDGSYVSWAQKKKYTGEKISVDFFETDIKNVFRIIRSVSGENFAIDKDVSGKVTMTLDKPVPWDQVLDLVLKMNMLGMITEGGINRIATLETLKMEEEKRLEYIAAEEKTKQKKKSLEPVITEYILINYSNAGTEIVPHIEKFLTPERGKVSVDTRTNQIILTDTEEKIKEARDLIKRLDKITPQVIIEARIVEATSNFSRNLGTEWTLNSNPNYDVYNDTLGGTYGYAVAMNNSVPATSSIGINFTRLTGAQFLLNAKLLAMESRGEGKIVSAPKILTMDNKQATITQGVEVPFETVSSEGTETTFKKIELKLEVTPHVTSDNKVSMKINIDKNDVGNVTDIGPTITTKKVESELLVGDGDTIVIGGIIKSNKSVTDSGIPLLQHIPVVGWLFKSRIRSEDKQELLVFLTPRIVSYEETVR